MHRELTKRLSVFLKWVCCLAAAGHAGTTRPNGSDRKIWTSGKFLTSLRKHFFLTQLLLFILNLAAENVLIFVKGPSSFGFCGGILELISSATCYFDESANIASEWPHFLFGFLGAASCAPPPFFWTC